MTDPRLTIIRLILALLASLALLACGLPWWYAAIPVGLFMPVGLLASYVCNFCSGEPATVNVTFVITGVTGTAVCTGTTCADWFNRTFNLTTAFFGCYNCLEAREVDFGGPDTSCGGSLGTNVHFFWAFSGVDNKDGGGNSLVHVDLSDAGNSCASRFHFARFEYTITGPLDCDATNGPYSMTRTSAVPDWCDGSAATATYQIGP